MPQINPQVQGNFFSLDLSNIAKEKKRIKESFVWCLRRLYVSIFHFLPSLGGARATNTLRFWLWNRLWLHSKRMAPAQSCSITLLLVTEPFEHRKQGVLKGQPQGINQKVSITQKKLQRLCKKRKRIAKKEQWTKAKISVKDNLRRT